MAFHMALSVLVAISATGLTLDMHFCRDTLYDIAVFSDAKNCCETGRHGEMECHDAAGEDPHHCEDAAIAVDPEEDLFLSTLSTEIPPGSVIHLFEAVRTSTVLPERTGSERFHNLPRYRLPPTGKHDIYSMIQSFLI